ncbi:MAG TPA: hypothetical protein PLE99_05905 [Candidatus Thiothrix moscowensis]|uniref:hypothetical protein n=1 Tax=unclassified Thiothrix TaxID=2636184 RepID=UPI0025F7786B|nr:MULTISPECIES: hypothetical protein [unclassified Thiothrix]HRJ52279.1 hypothetical protein [Candidatus Thiothrix moscowensis]HRJ92594.1 hypothetical protein [Candidatus Thiothrix moscowensis]
MNGEAEIICDESTNPAEPLFQVIRFTSREGYVTEGGQPVGCYKVIERKLTWGQLLGFLNQLTQVKGYAA